MPSHSTACDVDACHLEPASAWLPDVASLPTAVRAALIGELGLGSDMEEFVGGALSDCEVVEDDKYGDNSPEDNDDMDSRIPNAPHGTSAPYHVADALVVEMSAGDTSAGSNLENSASTPARPAATALASPAQSVSLLLEATVFEADTTADALEGASVAGAVNCAASHVSPIVPAPAPTAADLPQQVICAAVSTPVQKLRSAATSCPPSPMMASTSLKSAENVATTGHFAPGFVGCISDGANSTAANVAPTPISETPFPSHLLACSSMNARSSTSAHLAPPDIGLPSCPAASSVSAEAFATMMTVSSRDPSAGLVMPVTSALASSSFEVGTSRPASMGAGSALTLPLRTTNHTHGQAQLPRQPTAVNPYMEEFTRAAIPACFPSPFGAPPMMPATTVYPGFPPWMPTYTTAPAPVFSPPPLYCVGPADRTYSATAPGPTSCSGYGAPVESWERNAYRCVAGAGEPQLADNMTTPSSGDGSSRYDPRIAAASRPSVRSLAAERSSSSSQTVARHLLDLATSRRCEVVAKTALLLDEFSAWHVDSYGLFAYRMLDRTRADGPSTGMGPNDSMSPIYLNASKPLSLLALGGPGSGKTNTLMSAFETMVLQTSAVTRTVDVTTSLVLHFSEQPWRTPGILGCSRPHPLAKDMGREASIAPYHTTVCIPSTAVFDRARNGDARMQPLLFDWSAFTAPQQALLLVAVGDGDDSWSRTVVALLIEARVSSDRLHEPIRAEFEYYRTMTPPHLWSAIAAIDWVARRSAMPFHVILTRLLRWLIEPGRPCVGVTSLWVPGAMTVVDFSDPHIFRSEIIGVATLLVEIFQQFYGTTCGNKVLMLDDLPDWVWGGAMPYGGAGHSLTSVFATKLNQCVRQFGKDNMRLLLGVDPSAANSSALMSLVDNASLVVWHQCSGERIRHALGSSTSPQLLPPSACMALPSLGVGEAFVRTSHAAMDGVHNHEVIRVIVRHRVTASAQDEPPLDLLNPRTTSEASYCTDTRRSEDPFATSGIRSRDRDSADESTSNKSAGVACTHNAYNAAPRPTGPNRPASANGSTVTAAATAVTEAYVPAAASSESSCAGSKALDLSAHASLRACTTMAVGDILDIGAPHAGMASEVTGSDERPKEPDSAPSTTGTPGAVSTFGDGIGRDAQHAKAHRARVETLQRRRRR